MVLAGEDRLAARSLDRCRNFGRIRRHDHLTYLSFTSTPPDLHDHGCAGDIRQRLVWQAGGGQTGGDQNNGAHGRVGALGTGGKK